MKRTRLRRESKKRAALNRKVYPERRKYLEGRVCVLSGQEAHDVHEIVEGNSNRIVTFQDPRFWLPVNRLRHDELQNMPKAKQWALKAIHDRENFDPDAMEQIPGKRTSLMELVDELLQMVNC